MLNVILECENIFKTKNKIKRNGRTFVEGMEWNDIRVVFKSAIRNLAWY